jgi:hypothetical protein
LRTPMPKAHPISIQGTGEGSRPVNLRKYDKPESVGHAIANRSGVATGLPESLAQLAFGGATMGLARGDVRDGAQGHSLYGRARGRSRHLGLGIQDRASNQDRAAKPVRARSSGQKDPSKDRPRPQGPVPTAASEYERLTTFLSQYSNTHDVPFDGTEVLTPNASKVG